MSLSALEKRRADALKDLAAMSMPSSKDEVWRYSNIDELDLEAYELVGELGSDVLSHTPTAKDLAASVSADYGELSCLLVSQCGHFVDAWYSEEFLSSSAYAAPLAQLEQAQQGQNNSISYLGATMPEPLDIFAAMNDAHMADPLLINIPQGVDVQMPIGIVELADAGNIKSFPRLIVNTCENSSAQVLHILRSGQQANLIASVVELSLQPSSNLRYLCVEDLGPNSHQIGSQVASVKSQSNLSIGTVSLGGDSVRLRTDCHLEGRGASGDIMSLYFANSNQNFDFRTFQKHSAPDTQSNLLFKGAIDEKARLIYSGMIKITPEGKSTNAFQANHNLKLSEDAWVESVPNLEIETNDVVCSHASTVGPIDEDQRFYLESRGIPEAEAEKLIVAGFFKAALSKLPIKSAIPTIYADLVNKFSEKRQSGD